jgi:fermentation-respiration switch protein FrsA (DUF1100 family)
MSMTRRTWLGLLAYELALNLFTPKDSGKPLPLVVMVHGGCWIDGGRVDYNYYGVKLAQLGYAAAKVDYRVADQARYPAAVDDVRNAIQWLKDHAKTYNIDPNRIALLGGSAGGHLSNPKINLDPAWGFALQGGVDVELGQGWYLNADIKKVWLDTDTNWGSLAKANVSSPNEATREELISAGITASTRNPTLVASLARAVIEGPTPKSCSFSGGT